MERVHLVVGDALLERGLRGDGVGPRRHEAEPDRDSMHVRVHREEWAIEGEQEDARRRLRADAGESHERGPELVVRHRRERPVVKRHAALADSPKHRADADGLRGSEAAATDRAGERGKRCVGDLVPGREPPAEIRIRPVAVGVARVLRQDRQDKLIERRKVSRRWRCAIGARETTRDGAEAAPVHSSERIGNCLNTENVGIK